MDKGERHSREYGIANLDGTLIPGVDLAIRACELETYRDTVVHCCSSARSKQDRDSVRRHARMES